MNDLVFPLPLEPLRRYLLELSPEFIDLLQKFRPIRQELVRKKDELQRSDTGQAFTQPEETRAIRDAEWKVAEAFTDGGEEWIDFESDPELSLRHTLNLYQRAMTSGTRKVRTRSLFHEEREILHHGRSIPGFVLNLAFLADRHLLFVPKLETYTEARALSEVLHFWTRRTGKKPRIGIEFETVHGVVQAEEILFELKDFAGAATFDPVDYLSSMIRKLSARKEGLLNPIRDEQRFSLLAPIQERLRQIAERRGVSWFQHAQAIESERVESNDSVLFPEIPEFRPPNEEEVRALIRESLEYLVDAVASGESPDRTPESGRYSRFELARSLLWQWIHHEAISEDLYYRLRDTETAQITDPKTELATQLLDSLLLNGSFVDFMGMRSV